MKKSIIFSAVVAAFLVGCGDKGGESNAISDIAKVAVEKTTEVAKDTTAAAVDSAKEATKVAVEKTVEAAKAVATDTVEKVKETATAAVDTAKESVTAAAATATTATTTAVATATEKVVEAKDAAVAKATETKDAVVATATSAAAPTTDASKLFIACAGCHGKNAEKKALGKSQIIAGWDAAKTEAALNGYKDGSYGGAMKGVMAGQVTKLSADDIKALAAYIAGLK